MWGRSGAAAVGLVAIVIVAVAWLVWGASGEDQGVGDVPVDEQMIESDGEQRLSAERAREFEQGMNARDPHRLVEVALLGEDDDPAEVAEQALPAGSELVVDEQTFTEIEGGGAFVEARIVGEQEFRLRLLLVEVEGRWMLAGSDEPEPTS